MTFLRLLLAVLILVAPAKADEAYEALMTELAAAPSKAEADRLSGAIWQVWLTAPDEAAQEVLDNALERRANHDFLGAIRETNLLIEGWPDYAEGWNQRATLFYLTGQFERSLADVDEVLAREPRHFGALSGKAVILFNQGKLPLAQVAVREALKYHPFLNERAILQVKPGKDL
ncbi:TPR domain protein [Candidatus Rhodobacter oscarellae]|uniref:TPR domain protein n=1 Tax=Candidatus Rhodobacter oscarellae TaxID=1675527 RepID=A0A0J9E5W0_9RHOB|nr:hypothetical protein [Candidatus Rhodobacter lobularis]KMW57194.1 TPR domain protein [Candidatus Rhodobacter lobularis]